MTKIVLATDGGNTKTIAMAVALDGSVLGTGKEGCGDIYAPPDENLALSNIRRAGQRACEQSKGEVNVLAAVYSLAGADWPEDFDFLRSQLADTAKTVEIINDGLGALRAGSKDWHGVAVVCGTYTATAARNTDGTAWSAGFWQEPSGASELGRLALHSAYRAELGIGPETTLTDWVKDRLNVRSVEEVVHLLSARGSESVRPPTGAFAPLLLDASGAGDEVATTICVDHGRMLAEYGVAAARRVGLDDAHQLVLSGGVLRHSCASLREALVGRYLEAYPEATPSRSRLEPIYGAAFLALNHAGVEVTPAVERRLLATGPQSGYFETAG